MSKNEDSSLKEYKEKTEIRDHDPSIKDIKISARSDSHIITSTGNRLKFAPSLNDDIQIVYND